MELRAATLADMAAIQAIYAHHVRHGPASFEIEPPTVSEMGRRFESVTGGDYPYLVAVEGDGVLGYAYASAYRTRPGYRYTVEDSVYVAPAHLGRGIGKRLLGLLIAECERRGYRQMLAVIGESVESGLACVVHGLTHPSGQEFVPRGAPKPSQYQSYSRSSNAGG